MLVLRMDRIKNEYIRGTAHVKMFWRESQRAQTEMVWTRVGIVKYISRRMIRLELPGRKPRGIPKRRFMDVVKEDMKLVGMREEDAEDRVR